jgi:hypothetical protein
MNTYLIQNKVKFIREAQTDFFNLYKINYTPFTNKIYFYFFTYEQKKYVHKQALKFVYSNADTYTTEIDPLYCNLIKSIVPVDVCNFLETYTGTLLPKLLENNDKFFVYEYTEGNSIETITSDEFFTLKNHHENMQLTPFYNSMAYNLIRTSNNIVLIDLKHFENKKRLPFFVYLYNKNHGVNRLYTEEHTNLDEIVQHLALDYPMEFVKIITYK